MSQAITENVQNFKRGEYFLLYNFTVSTEVECHDLKKVEGAVSIQLNMKTEFGVSLCHRYFYDVRDPWAGLQLGSRGLASEALGWILNTTKKKHE